MTREERKQYEHDYYLANKEMINAKNRAYYRAHKEEIYQRNKQWKKDHPEIQAGYIKVWNANNKEKIRKKQQAWRSMKKANGGKTLKQITAEFDRRMGFRI